MNMPTSLHHRPVRIITIHRNRHPAAAGSDAAMEGVVIQLGKNIFQFIHILQRTGFRHISSVQQDVRPHFLDALFLRLLNHGDQMRDVGVHISVRQQTDEM